MALLFITACSTTRKLSEGEHLLVKNRIYVNNEKVKNRELNKLIKQKPNKKILGFWNLYLQLYNLGDSEKEKGLKAWFTRIGEPPVVLDSSLSKKSARQLGLYYNSKGYFNAEAGYELKKRKKKSRVSYYIYTGKPYAVRKIEYEIESPILSTLNSSSLDHSFLNSNMRYDVSLLDQERSRLTALFRERGLYNFSKENIRYVVDSIPGQYQVDVTMQIKDQAFSIGDSVYYRPYQPYKINKVFIQPDYQGRKQQDSLLDTARFSDYIFISREPVKYTYRTITDAIHLKPGEVFRQSKLDASYRHLSLLKIFKSISIRFEEDRADTSENALLCYIRLSPLKKQSITLETEGTRSTGNLGISVSTRYQNKNIFRGGEILELGFKGGVEAQNSTSSNTVFSTFELGTEVRLKIPRFLLPINTLGLFPKRMEPRTEVALSYNFQQRVEFTRSIFKTALNYHWNENSRKTHSINLFDVNYVKLNKVDESRINETVFSNGFRDNLIPATGYTFTYNDQKASSLKNFTFFRGHIETSGNILAAFDGPLQLPEGEEGNKKFLGVSYAQYAKFDADYRYYWNLTPSHVIASRIFAGIGIPYGNSNDLPFEKQFFAGGSNDIRAWQAYRLGPGARSDSVDIHTADIKLMTNLEYRFPIYKSLKGALFADAGNIWLLDEDADQEGGQFAFSDFAKQVALGSGFGLRYDFGFFVFRLDASFKIRDPRRAPSERWFPEKMALSNTSFNIALGYPF